jgi:hypothetical protein
LLFNKLSIDAFFVYLVESSHLLERAALTLGSIFLMLFVLLQGGNIYGKTVAW